MLVHCELTAAEPVAKNVWLCCSATCSVAEPAALIAEKCPTVRRVFKAVADLPDWWQTAVSTVAVLHCSLCFQTDPWLECRQEVTIAVSTQIARPVIRQHAVVSMAVHPRAQELTWLYAGGRRAGAAARAGQRWWRLPVPVKRSVRLV